MMARASIFILAATFWPSSAPAQSTERLYEEACDAGDLVACNVFGVMLELGDGATQDLPRAIQLYQRACEGGELIGCTNLGVLHESGIGLPQDLALARGLYRTACEGGEPLGCGLRDRVGQREVPDTARYLKSGRAGDAETRAVLAQTIIELPDLDRRAVSDLNGAFAFGGLPSGLHRLRAERVGYEALEGQVLVPGNPEFFVLLTPTELDDPNAPGNVAGRVVEGPDQGLANVEVTVVGYGEVSTLTNPQGRFRLSGLPPGVVVLRFARLGYGPRTATVIVQPGRTLEVGATMAVQPLELAAIDVTVRSRTLERNGFYDRMDGGGGTQFSPRRLETIAATLVSEVLIGRVPGITVEEAFAVGGTSRVWSRRGSVPGLDECVLAIFLDGIQLGDADLDLFPMAAIDAIEVYQGIETPLQYAVTPCGAVLLWTRQS
jgi:hypothetical protein